MKLSPKNYRLVLLLLVFVSETVFSQDNPFNEVSIASPNAASLGKYVDVPVNNHTGLPQVSIPIYTIKDGPIELPISLSYHAGGLKVSEPSSWIGAGWALNAGGMITRTVQGIPDEKFTGTAVSANNAMGAHFTDYGYHSYIDLNDSEFGKPTIKDFADGKADGEPDMFTFNFGKYSGKFIFGEDRTPILLPQQDVRIEYTYTSGLGKSIEAFKITTPDGMQYFFGVTPSAGDVDAIEKTRISTAQAGLTQFGATSSWYLYKIQSPDGQFVVTLNYAQEYYAYHTVSTNSLKHTEVGQQGKLFYRTAKNFVNGLQLSSITWSNGTVNFLPGSLRQDLAGTILTDPTDEVNTSARTLDVIEVRSNNNQLCKKFRFKQSYFYDNTTNLSSKLTFLTINTDRYRLKLDSLLEYSCDSSLQIPAHKFEYFTEKVPRRLSFAQDHWGFYNGQDINLDLISTYFLDKFDQVLMANREPSWPAMRGGSLKKITYPTGGNHELVMEPHDTWVSFLKHNATQRWTGALGFSGELPNFLQSGYMAFTGNPYRITLALTVSSQPPTATTGYLYVRNASGQIVAQINVNDQNRQAAKTVQVAPGQYKVEFSMPYRDAPDGIEAKLFEMIPFQYESNVVVGGLRIQSLKVSEAPGKEIQTNFSYRTGTQSSGILYARPTYVQVIRNDEAMFQPVIGDNGQGQQIIGIKPNECSPNGCWSCDIGAIRGYYISPAPIRPMEYSQGQHIGYNEVKVEKVGNGYSTYRYYGSNVWDLNRDDIAYRNANVSSPCDINIPNYPEAPPPNEWKRGEIKYEGHFDNNGNLIKETDYLQDYQDYELITPAIIPYYWYEPPSQSYIISTKYSIKSAKKVKTTNITRTRMSSGIVYSTTDITDFSSARHNQPTQQVRIASNGDTLKTLLKYTADLLPVNCDTLSSCIGYYNSLVNFVETSFNSAYFGCSTDACRYEKRVDRAMGLLSARRAFIDCRKTKFTLPGNTFVANLTSGLNAASTELKPIYDLNLKGEINLVEQLEFSAGKLTGGSYIQHAYTSQSPVYVFPNKSWQINLQTSSSTFSQVAVSGNNLTKDARYAEENNMVMGQGAMLELTKKSGISQSYIWDQTRNYPTAVTSNGKANEVAYSSFEDNSTGNWSYNAALVTTFTPHTGKRVYNMNASNAISKSGLQSTQTYLVSYWSRNTSAAYTVSGTVSGYPVTGSTINGWKYYEHKVTGVTSLSISGTGYIDEVRLYPTQAIMKTYTYEPAVGMTCQTDETSISIFFQYDPLGRLLFIRDKDQRILKKYWYQYNGQVQAQ